MEIENEIMETKARVRMSELRLKALINVLSREGIATSEEIEEELKELLKIKEENQL